MEARSGLTLLKAAGVLLALLSACPGVNSTPCDTDAQCPEGRCRRGACGPICVDGAECGDAQTCRAGRCERGPECTAAPDCADGFQCDAGLCLCTSDSACALTQRCLEGRCQTRPRCTAQTGCASNERCELTQGVCLPPCGSAADCLDGVDPVVANAAFRCFQGTCFRRCVGDVTCGDGLICSDGLCAEALCSTLSDCPQGQYCSSATNGRCLGYQACGAGQPACPANFVCGVFATDQCPPGFDCAQSICQELARCFVDADCASSGPPRYCATGHCQPSISCSAAADCAAAGQQCVGEVCVPAVCRGAGDCPPGQACSSGLCSPPPPVSLIEQTTLHPSSAVLRAGDAQTFTLTAFRPDGTSHPLASASFSVVDGAGQATTGASITSAGVFTASTAGNYRVRAAVAGSLLAPKEAPVRIYPAAPAMGRRVVVVDGTTGAPLLGALVRGCNTDAGGACTGPEQAVSTDAEGVALFPSIAAGAAAFSAGSNEAAPDGAPRYGLLSLGPTQAVDLLMPLPPNEVRSAAGFTGTLSFTEVQSTGTYWAGLAALSVHDVSAAALSTVLGDTFFTEVPGLGQRLPVPGAAVLYTSPGFGIAQEVKGKAYGLGAPGRRAAVAFAGRSDLNQALTARATDLLAYVGAFDYAIQPPVSIASFPRVPDLNDFDGDRLCGQPALCPGGDEELPDYARFAALTFRPSRTQAMRTEVVLPDLPAPLDSVVVAAVQVDPELGALPLGFSSRAGGLPGPDGLRPVESVVLRSGPPYGGLEATSPGVWAFALQTGTPGVVSGRLFRASPLPLHVSLGPFLPPPSGGTYATAGRVFAPGQPAWNAVGSAGATLGRVTLLGTQGSHDVYFPLQPGQTQVSVPPAPALGWPDPASETGAAVRVTALALASGTSTDEVFSFPGVNLRNLLLALEAYSRYE